MDTIVPTLFLSFQLIPTKTPADSYWKYYNLLQRKHQILGKLVNEIKDLRRGKKKLMDAIVSGMNEAENDRKKEKQKKLLIETKQKIEEESDRLMEVPYEIRKTNEELLVVSITYCYDKLKEREEYLQELTQDIEVQRAEIKQKVADKVELEESVDQTYGLMHALLGREVMNVFDHYK